MSAIRAQLQTIPLPTQSFAGQTIIVTGSNTGLGLEAARHFVRLDAVRVILAVRSLKKGEDAKALLESSSDRKNVVEVWQVDMSSYDSIKAFATRCDSLDRLDVVVANAGILRNTYEESEGVELTIKAKFLERKEDSIFKAFNQDKKSYIADRYNTSKLLEVLLVRSVAAAIQKGPHAAEPLIFNNVNPGLCHSELDKDVKGLASYILTFAKALIARTTEVGGCTLVHSAAAGSESHGQYMSEAKVKEPSGFVRSAEGAKVQGRVHKELIDILETIQPGITSNI
ncbi:hypothetical protein QQX98_001836 [Neonectria punicea]|uniref:Uncharacterized protein n=1 Tax=Neonectria punicea TaxID=979145 RepID=A0ABR1HLT5_9HYPO